MLECASLVRFDQMRRAPDDPETTQALESQCAAPFHQAGALRPRPLFLGSTPRASEFIVEFREHLLLPAASPHRSRQEFECALLARVACWMLGRFEPARLPRNQWPEEMRHGEASLQTNRLMRGASAAALMLSLSATGGMAQTALPTIDVAAPRPVVSGNQGPSGAPESGGASGEGGAGTGTGVVLGNGGGGYGGAGAAQDPYNTSYVLPNASVGTKTDTQGCSTLFTARDMRG